MIDVMIVYTAASRVRYGESGVQARIMQGVADANTAYQRSGVYITLNLVHLAEVTYTETGNMLDALVTLVGTTDGQLDEVHALRSQYAADLVVLINEDSGYAGISYMMGAPTVAFAPYAFSVTGSGYISHFTMQHEIGHNMGCDHDRNNSGGGGSFPYSFGYQRCTMDATGFRTVMSYPCSQGYGSRINYFSNPNVLYNGKPLGVAYEADPDHASENARSLNNTAHYVAAFYNPAQVELPPPTPQSLEAVAAGAQQVNLAWVSAATNEAGFKVERTAGGAAWIEVAIVPAGTQSYADNGLACSTLYAYRVQAYNSSGASDYSNEASVSTPEPLPLEPTNLAATAASASQINLTWVNVAPNAACLRLERSTDLLNWVELVPLTPETTGYSDTEVLAATGYHYRLRACNSQGCSAFSAVASATTLPWPPSAPVSLTALAVTGPAVSLTWQDTSANEIGFAIERSLDGVNFSALVVVGTDVTAFADMAVTTCQTYFYRVLAWNEGGNSAASAVASVGVTGGSAPAAPTTLAVSALGTTALKLTWRDNASDETGMQVERSFDGTSFSVIATLAPNTIAWTNSSLAAATKYYYRVRALKACLASAPTSVASASTAALPPATPSALLATSGAVGSKYITLAWLDNAANESAQYLQQSTDGVTWKALATLSANVKSYRHSKLMVGTTYSYRIRSYNAAGGYSAYSNITSAVAR